jgi:hypothetical protein
MLGEVQTAPRSLPARDAGAAALCRGEPPQVPHERTRVGVLVKGNQAAVAEGNAPCGEALDCQRRLEFVGAEEAAERPADLDHAQCT